MSTSLRSLIFLKTVIRDVGDLGVGGRRRGFVLGKIVMKSHNRLSIAIKLRNCV